MKKTIYEAPMMEQIQVRFEQNIMSNKAASTPAQMTTHDSSEWGAWE